ncbi:methyl-accepting chemotaxis protein [Inhella crocodyli]|uniref:Methyl-accepting chemotaxis protein n=1 Tax=Inhella crocodyli TaxID=2499851 RepID=A0A437LAU0_9BURK|nr:methyl-accepting chemotaxis protein [Inhella crocodyli]RVT82469.1 methyl-accepting chemotaxis protein [Inhella crocodyli]
MKSLKQRLFALGTGVVLLALLVATAASYFDARGHVRAQSLALLDEVAQGQAQAIGAWVEVQQNIVESLKPAVALDDPRPFLAQAAQSGSMDLAYIGHEDKRMLQHKDMPLSDGYDPTKRPWYLQAAGSDKVVLTEPYIDDSTKKPVITFAKAVKDGGGTKAVVASDVYMDGVVATLKRIKPTPSGFALLVSADGRVMAHPNPALLLKPASDLAAVLTPAGLKALSAPGGGWLEGQSGTQSLLLRGAPVAGTDWMLVVASDAGEALAPLKSLLLKAVGVTVVMVALAGALMGGMVNRMLGGLQRTREAMDEVGAGGGDLTRRLPVEGEDEVAQIAKAFNTFAEKLQGIMRDVNASTGSIGTASSEIAMGAQDLSQRTEQTASNLQQASSAMDNLTAAVRQTADSATTANQLAASAAEAAAKGGAVVGQVVSTMQDINTSSRRISDIIGVIDGIAFQTNILALNAAVEAARAGEQGRGFAVVAGEVRSLAQRSAEAAREIKGLIGASVERVEAGSSLVQEAGAAMDEIVAGVRRVTDIIGEISAAAREQSEGIGSVNGTMAQLDQATQQNAALVEQSAAAAESLKDQAQRLADIIAVFKVGQGTLHQPPALRSAPAAKGPAPAPRPAAAKAAPPAARPAMAARSAPAAAPVSAPPASGGDGDWETF